MHERIKISQLQLLFATRASTRIDALKTAAGAEPSHSFQRASIWRNVCSIYTETESTCPPIHVSLPTASLSARLVPEDLSSHRVSMKTGLANNNVPFKRRPDHLRMPNMEGPSSPCSAQVTQVVIFGAIRYRPNTLDSSARSSIEAAAHGQHYFFFGEIRQICRLSEV